MGRGVVVVTDEARGVTGVPPDVPVVIGVVVVVVAAVVAVVTAVVDVVVAGATVVGVVVTTGGGAKRQVGTVIVLSSIVTAPLIARARPFTVAPVFSVIDVVARIDPAKSLVVPKVAELPTCQNTLHACARGRGTCAGGTGAPRSRVPLSWQTRSSTSIPLRR